MNEHPGLIEWLAGGHRGVSSDTIVATLTGLPTSHGHKSGPWDAGDFGRCEELLRNVPTLRPLMPKMGDESAAWEALVERWDEITATIEREDPGWKGGYMGSTPEASKMVRACRGES